MMGRYGKRRMEERGQQGNQRRKEKKREETRSQNKAVSHSITRLESHSNFVCCFFNWTICQSLLSCNPVLQILLQILLQIPLQSSYKSSSDSLSIAALIPQYMQFKLYSIPLNIGGRGHPDLVCWDLRNTRTELGRVKRPLNSNQKMTFALDPWGKYLATGTQDGQ